MSEKATPTTTTQNTSSFIPDWLTNASEGVVNNATNGGIPGYTPYTGPNTQAGLTPQQLQALGIASGAAGTTQGTAAAGLPGYTSALNFAAPQINAGSLNNEVSGLLGSSSPFTQNLINATNAQMDTNTAQAVDNTNVGLAAEHAFGGTAPGVADANIENQALINKNATDAGLMQSGYNNALSTALGSQTTNAGNAIAGEGINLSGAAGMGNLAQILQGLNSGDINNLLSTGGTAQTTQSGQNQFDFQNYLEGFQIPDTQMSTIASILGSVPHSTQGTSTTQSEMFTNPLLSALGLGLGGLSLMGSGGASAFLPGASFLSGNVAGI